MAYPGVKLSTPTIYHNGQYQSDIVFNGVQWTHGTGFGDTAAEARREAIRKANNFQRQRTFVPWAVQNGVLKLSETSPSLFFHGNPARGGTSTASRTATRTATEATTTGNKTSTSTGGASTSGGNVSISVKHNPATRVGGKGLTLRNMAVVTVKRLPGGAVAITGRKMAGR